jgi:hypothetical protein
MQHNIIDVRYARDPEVLDAIEEAMNDQNLVFNATSLKAIGFESLLEISKAVERAMAVCNCNGIEVKEHFKSIYISDNDKHTIERDWKLSKLAYTLTIINGASDNPMVARLQFAILQKYIDSQKDW